MFEHFASTDRNVLSRLCVLVSSLSLFLSSFKQRVINEAILYSRMSAIVEARLDANTMRRNRNQEGKEGTHLFPLRQISSAFATINDFARGK